MISISSIKSYMFCPMKLYLEKNFEKESDDIIIHKTIKELRVDLNDLFQRNIRKTKKEMSLNEIEESLNKNIEEYIESSFSLLNENIAAIDKKEDITINTNLEHDLEDSLNIGRKEDIFIENDYTGNNFIENNLENIKTSISNVNVIEEEIEKIDRINELKRELESEIYYNLKILSLKVKKAMLINQKDGNQIAELFFPTSMYSYLMRDTQLDIVGACDKIEIIEGKYFPISVKSSNPPLKGVWDGDAIELAASALLIENEFDTEVFVGFIDYLKIGDRRIVVMDAHLRKNFFRILNEVNTLINNDLVPEIKKDAKKCNKCNYKLLCMEK
ncbi:CRISPR-associated protein Cas4 [Methanobrevibacter sp.]|uniref:CRISPR-associated protein Cas4 n=1 Tax=Methanobrevibacter sp. TaxID=66852 RepID=UPI002612FDDB|nr:Dna2/Cas4 domain-containing protein [uncultured Methanobrevibacter sp.]